MSDVLSRGGREVQATAQLRLGGEGGGGGWVEAWRGGFGG